MLDMPFRALVKKMRLNEAFLRLENPGPEETVASVANELFFWHPGNVAHDYCARHYENPFRTATARPQPAQLAPETFRPHYFRRAG